MNASIDEMEKRKKKRKKMFLITFFTAIVFITATYAWLSVTLNVKINFFRMEVSTDRGLFISLDGIDFSDAIMIDMNSVVIDLKERYPNHTNQWSATGLWPVSTNGIKTSDDNKFDIYQGRLLRTKLKNPNNTAKRVLTTFLAEEHIPSTVNSFISFDIFLKNVSGSPKSDNLFFDDGTGIEFEEDMDNDTRKEMQGLMNSMRIGIVRIGTVPLNSDVSTIQNVGCNSECASVIYEPYSTAHTNESVETAKNYGITLVPGVYIPTYGIINEGKYLEHTNGHAGTGIPLISSHFAPQETIKDFEDPIFQLPNAITKLRVYIWIEGQDIDSLETYSKGAGIDIVINLIKDLAGYE